MYKEGDSIFQIHIILDGEVKISRLTTMIDDDGLEFDDLATLVTLSKGQFFGHGKVTLLF